MLKRIGVLLLSACLIITGLLLNPWNCAQALSQKAITDWAVSYTTYDTTYEAIIKMYLKVINGYDAKNYGRHDLFNIRIIWDGPSDAPSKYLIQYAKENAGFYIEDINQDGIDELIINSTHGRIYEIFTIDEDKVREVFRGSRYGACYLLNNGKIYRCYQIEGEEYVYHELWQMNGTGKADFIEGYHTDQSDWYRSETDIRKIEHSQSERVSTAEAENWVNEQEKRIVRHRFIPFKSYEKMKDDPGNIAVLAKDNKTSGSAKIRIRREPSQNAKIVETKKVGTYVKVLSKEDGYYKIRIGKNKISCSR